MESENKVDAIDSDKDVDVKDDSEIEKRKEIDEKIYALRRQLHETAEKMKIDLIKIYERDLVNYKITDDDDKKKPASIDRGTENCCHRVGWGPGWRLWAFAWSSSCWPSSCW